MRCLIYATKPEAPWLNEFFPGVEPYLLKIVNKPLLEYYLDFASILGVSEVRFVSDSSINLVENVIKNGAKWGLNVSYSLAKPEDSVQSVISKNSSFCAEDDLLVLNGYFFTNYDSSALTGVADVKQVLASFPASNRLIYIPLGEQQPPSVSQSPGMHPLVEIREITSITDYYNLSMFILKEKNKSFVLPGYSNENDTFLGLNLIYPGSSEISPPVMIGNNCRFKKYTAIGPNTIIGDNVIIEDNTSVSDSIIYDNTFLGGDLEIDQKIVSMNYLINAITGKSILIKDRILVSKVDGGLIGTRLHSFVSQVATIILICIQFVPWLALYLPFALFFRDRKSERLLSRELDTKLFDDPEKIGKTLYGKLMLRLSLDKFGQLCNSVRANLYLVGNNFFTNTPQNCSIVQELPEYHPGVFSLVESLRTKEAESTVFYELEYLHNQSTKLNLVILIRVLLVNLFLGRS